MCLASKLLLTCHMCIYVLSSIRPTQLQYTELYDFDTCAKFIADHVSYEPLEVPALPMPRSSYF